MILHDVCLSLKPRTVYGLSGENGSGKTMLLKAISGLIYPTSGIISVNGEIIGKEIDHPDDIGVLLEHPSFVGAYSGMRNLKLLAGLHGLIGDSEIASSIKAVGLDPSSRKPYRKYSLGMKQRLGIACVVMEKPSIVLLDEPLNALDESGIALVSQIVRRMRNSGALVVVAEHNGEKLRKIADEMIVIHQGSIVDQFSV